MRARGLVPMMLVAASLFVGSPEPAKAGVSVGVGVSVGGFHNSLAAYGTWSNHPTYGSVWAPSHVAAGWRPYTAGHWNDVSGQMTWVSDEPWGDTYHYGHWVFDPVLGWIWIPGTTWAPAWVTWRYGGGYVGWAPTPLFATAVVDPYHFCFVPQRYVTERVLSRHFVPAQRNVTIVNVTKRTTVLPASVVPRRSSVDSFRSTQQRSTIDSSRSTRERDLRASTEPSRSTQQRSTIDSSRSTRERGLRASTEPSRSTQQRSSSDSFRSTRERGLQASTEPSRSTQQRSSSDSFRSTRQSAWQRNDDRVRSTNSRPAWSHPEARSSVDARRSEAPRQSWNERTALRGSQERPRTIAAPVHNSRPTHVDAGRSATHASTGKPAAQQRGASTKHATR